MVYFRKWHGVSEEERFMDATGQVNDTYRITFVEDHLRQLHRAIEDGSPCFGYHMWTFMDCWSWLNAYKTAMVLSSRFEE